MLLLVVTVAVGGDAPVVAFLRGGHKGMIERSLRDQVEALDVN